MIKSLLIKGGRIIDPGQEIDWTGNLLIREDKIVWLSKGRKLPPEKDYDILPAKGLVVCPGFIDFHCHLREPGFEMKETIATGTRAAAKGGFTTVCYMPNTRPPLDNAELIQRVNDKADRESLIRVFPIGCVTRGRKGNALVYMESLVKAGVVGFSDDGDPVKTAELMQEALEISKVFNLPIIDHCEDPIGGPPEGEKKIVARDLEMAGKTKSWVHIAHVSTAGSVDMIRKAKEKGVRVTAEVTAHHLTLTKEMVQKHGALAKLNPPLRTENDCSALIQGLKESVIDIIATDHAPHTMAEKQNNFENAPAGISGFETALGSLMSLVHSGRLELNELIACMTTKPAKILGKPFGSLALDTLADITIFDPDKEWTVDVNKFASMGKNTPLNGATLKGKVIATIYQGNLVYKDDSVKIGLRS
ncbi:MAG: dihydroorotase [Dehalococcoidales bacterium]|nr:dihydroorotase [Dehalococcoidales bacterium]